MAIPGDAVHAIQWVAHQYRRLIKEADAALNTQDREQYESSLLAAGRLIQALPAVARGLLDDSAASIHVMDSLQTMADQATRFVDRSNYFGLSSFLNLHGSGPDDPNILERLIAGQSEGL